MGHYHQAVEEELQLVRARLENAAVRFPKADPTEIGDGEAFEIIREDDIIARAEGHVMAFHEVRFPDNISRGARGGPERRTQIVELASRDIERNASWANSRRRYDVVYGIRRADDLAAVVAFFEARNGRLHGFRFKDWGDHKSCLPSGTPSPTDQEIGTGDGTTTAFQLVKRYASPAATRIR
jgi:Holliday junction resolvase-like predicted endonuclease